MSQYEWTLKFNNKHGEKSVTLFTDSTTPDPAWVGKFDSWEYKDVTQQKNDNDEIKLRMANMQKGKMILAYMTSLNVEAGYTDTEYLQMMGSQELSIIRTYLEMGDLDNAETRINALVPDAIITADYKSKILSKLVELRNG